MVFDVVEDVQPVDHLSKNDLLVIKIGTRPKRNHKLRTIRVAIAHTAKQAGPRMQHLKRLISKGFSIDGSVPTIQSACPCVSIGENLMKDRTDQGKGFILVSGLPQKQLSEVLGCFWDDVFEELNGMGFTSIFRLPRGPFLPLSSVKESTGFCFFQAL